VADVVLFGRTGCHLCDDARAIETDEALLRAYLERIPVVTIDGAERFELFVDESELIAAVDGV
jgi:hypothetical protein